MQFLQHFITLKINTIQNNHQTAISANNPFANNTKKSMSPHDAQIQHKIFTNNAYPDFRQAGDNIYNIIQLVLTQIFHISIISRTLNFFNNTYKK